MPISTNDTTILALLSRYPNLPSDEVDDYVRMIEHEDNIPVCYAVIGRILPEDLNEDSRIVYEEFCGWSEDRTRRMRNAHWADRRRGHQSRTSDRMAQLHERGLISNEMMLMYGISGDMPERHTYMTMTPEEKEALWSARMEHRLGPNWRERFEDRRFRLPTFLRERSVGFITHNWVKEGF